MHVAGQGVSVARMAAEGGAHPILCGLVGGEPGTLLRTLLEQMPGERRLTETAGASGNYVVDRRDGARRIIAQAWSAPPSRHELDDLLSVTCAAALGSQAFVLCNPFPGDVLPLEVYGQLVADVRANGTPVLVDLSSPRLESALEGGPEVVKLNDWELAEFVCGPVEGPALREAAETIRDRGAAVVVVTRGEHSAVMFTGSGSIEFVPPRFSRGHREGCGDAMAGAMSVALARGESLSDAVRFGAAAGAANFLRHGLGSASAQVVDELVPQVVVRDYAEPVAV